MFGFSLSENFNYPYTSLSIQEFWRRWHMTLSFWFRDYIYIPLGGNRKGLSRTLLNIFVVFLATGIWHGANLTFLFWGLWFAFLSIIERLFLGKLLNTNPIKAINWIYMILSVSLGWVLFRSPNLYHACHYLKALFVYVPEAPGTSIVSYFNANLLLALVVGMLLFGWLQQDHLDNEISVQALKELSEGDVLVLLHFERYDDGHYDAAKRIAEYLKEA